MAALFISLTLLIKGLRGIYKMDFSLIATILGILGGGGLLGLLGKVWNMGTKYQDLLNRVEANEKRDAEERENNNKKFTELYNSRNKTNETLVELNTTLKLMLTNFDNQFSTLNKKIDEMRKESINK